MWFVSRNSMIEKTNKQVRHTDVKNSSFKKNSKISGLKLELESGNFKAQNNKRKILKFNLI
jgi:hypothetical protein